MMIRNRIIKKERDVDSDPAPIQHDVALECLMNIQKSNLDDTKLFELPEVAMNQIQSKKTITDIKQKNVQPSLLKLFMKS